MRLQAAFLLIFLGACGGGEATDAPPAEGADLVAAADSPSAPAVMPEHAAVLPDSAGPSMLRQCSRGAPKDVRGYWTPGAAEVVAFERKLMPMLQAALDSVRAGQGGAKAENYLRQYVGLVTADGRRVVYVNGFQRTSAVEPGQFDGMTSVPDSLFLTARLDPRWRTMAWVACDGGHQYFGAEFDPATGEIGDFQFNGPPGRV